MRVPNYYPGPYHAGPYVRLIVTGPIGAVLAAGPLVALAVVLARFFLDWPWVGALCAAGFACVFAISAIAEARATRAARLVEAEYRDLDGIDEWIDRVPALTRRSQKQSRGIAFRGSWSAPRTELISSSGGATIGTLIPVLIALLLFFMAGAPRLLRAHDVRLVAGPLEAVQSTLLSMDENRQVEVDGTPVALDEVAGALRAIEMPRGTPVLLWCDESIPYAGVVRLIDAARGAGVSDIVILPDSEMQRLQSEGS